MARAPETFLSRRSASLPGCPAHLLRGLSQSSGFQQESFPACCRRASQHLGKSTEAELEECKLETSRRPGPVHLWRPCDRGQGAGMCVFACAHLKGFAPAVCSPGARSQAAGFFLQAAPGCVHHVTPERPFSSCHLLCPAAARSCILLSLDVSQLSRVPGEPAVLGQCVKGSGFCPGQLWILSWAKRQRTLGKCTLGVSLESEQCWAHMLAGGSSRQGPVEPGTQDLHSPQRPTWSGRSAVTKLLGRGEPACCRHLSLPIAGAEKPAEVV